MGLSFMQALQEAFELYLEEQQVANNLDFKGSNMVTVTITNSQSGKSVTLPIPEPLTF